MVGWFMLNDSVVVLFITKRCRLEDIFTFQHGRFHYLRRPGWNIKRSLFPRKRGQTGHASKTTLSNFCCSINLHHLLSDNHSQQILIHRFSYFKVLTMAPRTVSLVSYRNSSAQHAHFAILVPSSSDENRGTLIHVVGAPMAGYSLEFKRNYDIALTTQLYTIYPIGQIDSQHIVDSAAGTTSKGANHNGGAIEVAATQVAPPAISQNFLAPVNDVSQV